MGSLTSLRQLDVANNKLTSLPNELGLLTQLEILKANNNRITSLPESIGDCSFLMEVNKQLYFVKITFKVFFLFWKITFKSGKFQVDLSANMISELPETVTKLRKLKVNQNHLLVYSCCHMGWLLRRLSCVFGGFQTLELNNTGLTTLPSVLFKMCLQLSTLGLHNTEITVESLRQVCLFLLRLYALLDHVSCMSL